MRLPILSASLVLTLAHLCSANVLTSRYDTLEKRADVWDYVACYNDPFEARVLPAYHFQSNSMSIDSCQTRCREKGYLMAGIEYGIECWCDNQLIAGAVKLEESRCDMACASGGGTCGGSNTLSVFKVTPDNTPPEPGKWNYISCYNDPAGSRLFEGYSYVSDSMTVDSCLDACLSRGYDHGGLEYGRECYCGYELSTGATKADEEDCSVPCAGNSTEKCGGGWKASVYSFSGPGKPDKSDLPEDWSSVGCYTDNGDRALRSANMQSSEMTPGKCAAFCKQGGYPLAATENGSECFCGSTIYKENGSGASAPKSDCAVPCTGDSFQTCGGGWRLNVYRGPASLQYFRTEHVVGSDFYDFFRFEDIPDPTHGRVNYVNRERAQSTNLTYASDDTFILRADYKTTLSPSGPGRDSVRLLSKKTFGKHVAVFDIRHMPQGCGTWPAVWTTTETTWPNGGEIDILEGVNDRGPNGATLHTTEGCTMPQVRDQLGSVPTTNCDHNVNWNAGCGVAMSEDISYGPPFNTNGGGWYALERTDKFIKVWFWGRHATNVPKDVKEGQSTVDTSKWGMPQALFPDTQCDIPKYFEPHNIVINLALCGDWAGEYWTYLASGCPSTCDDHVNTNPAAFKNAYFDFASISIYTR